MNKVMFQIILNSMIISFGCRGDYLPHFHSQKKKSNETWQHCCSFLYWAYYLATPLTSSIDRTEEAVMSTRHISCQQVLDKWHTWLPGADRCNHVKLNVCKAS